MIIRWVNYRKREVIRKSTGAENIIAFYHPFTNACGGGEKVFFLALSSIADIIRETNCKVVVYTVEELDADQIIRKAQSMFNFKLRVNIQLIRIKKRYFTDQSSMVKLSLLSQALGNIVSVVEALTAYPPDIFIDTIGVGFSYPFVKILCPSVKLISYTHYPFIQEDMLGRARTLFKKYYYNTMLILYKCVGQFADLILANSTWTNNHLCRLWR